MTSSRPVSPLLQLTDISHSYGLQEVLQGIDLHLEPGERLALVGPSGCGKTTLMHLIAGLVDHQKGQIEHRYRRGRMVFQQPRLLLWQNTLDNLTLGLKAIGFSKARREAEGRRMARSLGLSDGDLLKYPDQLSGGMQSRVALGRALITQPDLLLLDEPFSALDVGHKERLYQDLIRMTGEHCSVIFITHDLLEAVRLADRILVMAPEPGQIMAQVAFSLDASLRDDLYVHHNGARLLQNPDVRLAFGLPPIVTPDSAASTTTAPAQMTACLIASPSVRNVHSC